jgi:CHAT domain-containing protein
LLGQGKKDASDDNFLTLSDVLDLDVGARLVVLANGHVGHGQAMMGQGVINMARAFLYAGARSILLNLWDVQPAIAREFFGKFYGYIQKGKSEAEALHLVKNDIRLAHPNPVFWAGYVLYGEGND